MKSLCFWIQTSPYVFRDINCGGCMIGVMDDFGTLVEIPLSCIVQFFWETRA